MDVTSSVKWNPENKGHRRLNECKRKDELHWSTQGTRIYTLWRIDPLLGKDLKTNNEPTVVAV
jgi:hypothetical protein